MFDTFMGKSLEDWMGFETGAELIASYRATPTILRALLAGVGDDQAGRRPAGAGWAIVEVVAHLAEAEERAHERVRRMLGENDPELPAYDEAALASEHRYLDRQLADALDRFERERAAQVATLRTLTGGQWARTGRHAEVGSITVEGYTAHMAAHDLTHLAQIAGLLSTA